MLHHLHTQEGEGRNISYNSKIKANQWAAVNEQQQQKGVWAVDTWKDGNNNKQQ